MVCVFLTPQVPPTAVLADWEAIEGCHDVLDIQGFKVRASFGGQIYIRIAVEVDVCFQSDDIKDTLNYVPLLDALQCLASHQSDISVLVPMFQELCMCAPFACGINAWTHHTARPCQATSAPCGALVSCEALSGFVMNVVIGCAESERYTTQAIVGRIFVDVDSLPYLLHGDTADRIRQRATKRVEAEQCFTIERVAALLLDSAGHDCAHISQMKVVVEKPEIGLLTNHVMEFASFSLTRRRVQSPPSSTSSVPHPATFPHLPPKDAFTGKAMSVQPPLPQDAAENFRQLAKSTTEYEYIHDNVVASLNDILSKHPSPSHLRVLDVGSGYGWLTSCFEQIRDDHPNIVLKYTAIEPNYAFHDDLHLAAQRLGLSCENGSFQLLTERYTATTKLDDHFDLIVFCHSLYEDKRNVKGLLINALSHLTLHGRCLLIHGARRLFDILPQIDQDVGAVAELIDVAVEPASLIVPDNTQVAMQVLGAYYGLDLSNANVSMQQLVATHFCGRTFSSSMATLVWKRRPSSPSAVASVTPPAAPLTPMDMLRGTLSQDEALFLPGTPSYNSALNSVKNRAARCNHPLAIASPSSVEEVVMCVTWCSRYGVPFTVAGGGHSGHCTANDELVISLARMQVAALDSTKHELTCQGGVTQDHIVSVLDAHGLMIPLGSRPSVGMGLVLHGGLGHYGRSFGFACDYVVGGTLVLPTGRVVSCGDADTGDEQRTLLTCLRGAGSMLGVVVSITFACVPFVPLVIHGHPLPFTTIDAYFEASVSAHEDCSLDAYVTAPTQPIASMTQSFHLAKPLGSTEAHHAPLLGITEPPAITTQSYRDIFEAELHREFPKAAEDFKRTILVPKAHARHAAGVLSAAIALPPTSKCYLHIMQCAPSPNTSRHRDSVGVTPRAWEWAVVITARWDNTADAGTCRHWVYGILDALPMCFVYATDLGHGPRDAVYAHRAFTPSAHRRIATIRRDIDPCLLLSNGRGLLFLQTLLPNMFVAAPHQGQWPDTPSLVIAICGKRCAGKDTIANVLKDLLEGRDSAASLQMHLPPSPQPLTARVVSISDGFKRDWCQRHGKDFARMLQDRDYKEQFRPAMNQEAANMSDQQCIAALQGCLFHEATDVVIVTGMREANVPDVLAACGVPALSVLVVADKASRERRGWLEGPSDLHPRETNIDAVTSWHVVLTNNVDGVNAMRDSLMDDVVPLVMHAVRRKGTQRSEQVDVPLAVAAKAALRSIKDFPLPGIYFQDINGLTTRCIESADGGALLLQRIVQWMSTVIRTSFTGLCDAIVTVESGGCIWASPVAAILGVPLIVVRKGNGGKEPPPSMALHHHGSNATRRATSLELRCGALRAATNVVLVDDVFASGSTAECVERFISSLSSVLQGVVCVGRFPLAEDARRNERPMDPLLSDRVPIHALLHFPHT